MSTHSFSIDFSAYKNSIHNTSSFQIGGKVEEVIGFVIKAYNPGLHVGSMCEIYNPETKESIPAEAVGFRKDFVFVMPLGELRGVSPKSRIIPTYKQSTVSVDESLLGRAIDGLGNPIDDLGPIFCKDSQSLYNKPINPLKRKLIKEPLDVGIKAINGLLTSGKGQRIGILAGSGVGKSVLLGMMAKHTTADVNVIALIGERGREVKEFMEINLNKESRKKTILIVATSDESPLIRMRGAFIATSIAEYFRKQGKDVLLMMDSITRFAMAQREIGLAVGEPPTTKGYPPSVFSMLPKLLERVGNSDSKGSITGFYTVLVEGDDLNDPISDSVRSIVDGHIVLNREIASKGHYPAIDILNSTSRVMMEVISKTHYKNATRFNEIFSIYKQTEDLINIGAYVAGSNPKVDYAIKKVDEMNQFLKQEIDEKSILIQCEATLEHMFQDYPE